MKSPNQEKKIGLTKEARGRSIIQQSKLEILALGVQQSNQSASLNFSGHEANSSRTKKGASKVDWNIFVHLGREICKRAIFANSNALQTRYYPAFIMLTLKHPRLQESMIRNS